MAPCTGVSSPHHSWGVRTVPADLDAGLALAGHLGWGRVAAAQLAAWLPGTLLLGTLAGPGSPTPALLAAGLGLVVGADLLGQGAVGGWVGRRAGLTSGSLAGASARFALGVVVAVGPVALASLGLVAAVGAALGPVGVALIAVGLVAAVGWALSALGRTASAVVSGSRGAEARGGRLGQTAAQLALFALAAALARWALSGASPPPESAPLSPSVVLAAELPGWVGTRCLWVFVAGWSWCTWAARSLRIRGSATSAGPALDAASTAPRSDPPTEPVGLFVYGTLRSGGAAHDLLAERVRWSQAARCRGALYELRQGYPALVANDEGWVEGDLLHLAEPAPWTQLDAYEGYLPDALDVSLYHRVIRPVQVEGRWVSAWCYVMPPDREPLRPGAGARRVPGGRWPPSG